MVKFNRYEEFNKGKIVLSIPALKDEKEIFGDDTIEVELIITAKQSTTLKGMVKAMDTLLEIMETSYPSMEKGTREAFVIRHADDLVEKFMLWSGVTQEKMDEYKKAQETIIKDFLEATPEERKKYIKDKINANNS